uniref:Caudal type homeobox 2 n=1 Tax=Laticauda laticaudata TaxID=8630 RepID=A0A8C5S0Y7_LATLA
ISSDHNRPSYKYTPTNQSATHPPTHWLVWMCLFGGHKSLKTRTKDKYRVVYTDHQRLELEKEFHYSRYITIRRKAELAATLGLSERQVKIWFQNRRAKERKINKKKLQQSQPGSEPLSPVSSMQAGTPGSVPSGGVLGATGLTPTVEEKKNH